MLDNDGTLTAQSLSKAHREPLRGVARGVLVAIGISLCFMPEAGGSKPVQYISYKEYALHSLDYNVKEYKCLSILYGKESAWNPNAVNGSHYGIPQLKNELMIGLDPYRQIDYGLKYIKHRYKLDELGYINACAAWKHFERRSWH